MQRQVSPLLSLIKRIVHPKNVIIYPPLCLSKTCKAFILLKETKEDILSLLVNSMKTWKKEIHLGYRFRMSMITDFSFLV